MQKLFCNFTPYIMRRWSGFIRGTLIVWNERSEMLLAEGIKIKMSTLQNVTTHILDFLYLCYAGHSGWD